MSHFHSKYKVYYVIGTSFTLNLLMMNFHYIDEKKNKWSTKY